MTLDEAIAELRRRDEGPVNEPLRLPTVLEVDDAERELGVPFHPDHRRFLLSATDVTLGTLDPATVGVGAGHRDLCRMAADAREAWGLPRELVPICDSNSDYFCMTPGGRVILWTHDGGPNGEEWPDLAAWIVQVWIGEADHEDDPRTAT